MQGDVVDVDADLVNWDRSKCAEEGLEGPESYVLTPKEENCDAEANAIRRKLCLVKQQMEQLEQPKPTV
jgi:hypothetical protein